MTATQSEFGKIKVFNDFTAVVDALVVPTGGAHLGGGVGLVGVNEGSCANTVDEPGGVLALVADTADNDNEVLVAGPFKPADGGCWMEARFKMASITAGAIYVGFTETLSASTPVMPAEFDTITMTYNGTGGMVGFNFDPDGTTDDFRAVFGDGGAVVSGADAAGTRANETITADEWYIARVVIEPNGTGKCYLGHKTADLQLIKEVSEAMTETDVFHAILMIENRAGAASTLEVDYFAAEGNRDWTN